jgi:hypothetical protein
MSESMAVKGVFEKMDPLLRQVAEEVVMLIELGFISEN